MTHCAWELHPVAGAVQIAAAAATAAVETLLLQPQRPHRAMRLTVKPTPKVNFLPSFCFTLKSATPDGLCANFQPSSVLETRVISALGVALLAGMVNGLITIDR